LLSLCTGSHPLAAIVSIHVCAEFPAKNCISCIQSSFWCCCDLGLVFSDFSRHRMCVLPGRVLAKCTGTNAMPGLCACCMHITARSPQAQTAFAFTLSVDELRNGTDDECRLVNVVQQPGSMQAHPVASVIVAISKTKADNRFVTWEDGVNWLVRVQERCISKCVCILNCMCIS
jgi:hypothetical protein